jgi:hypothetical protein
VDVATLEEKLTRRVLKGNPIFKGLAGEQK